MRVRLAGLIIAGAVLALPPAVAAGPEATAARNCGTVKTRNGGRALYVSTSGRGLRCRTARRVARRARGQRRYRYLGFRCKWRKKVSGDPLYVCSRISRGRGQGIAFIYQKP